MAMRNKLSSKNKLNPLGVSVLFLICRITHSILLGNPPQHSALFPKAHSPFLTVATCPEPVSLVFQQHLVLFPGGEGAWPPWLPGFHHRTVPWDFLYNSDTLWVHWLLPVLPKCRHWLQSLHQGSISPTSKALSSIKTKSNLTLHPPAFWIRISHSWFYVILPEAISLASTLLSTCSLSISSSTPTSGIWKSPLCHKLY